METQQSERNFYAGFIGGAVASLAVGITLGLVFVPIAFFVGAIATAVVVN